MISRSLVLIAFAAVLLFAPAASANNQCAAAAKIIRSYIDARSPKIQYIDMDSPKIEKMVWTRWEEQYLEQVVDLKGGVSMTSWVGSCDHYFSFHNVPNVSGDLPPDEQVQIVLDQLNAAPLNENGKILLREINEALATRTLVKRTKVNLFFSCGASKACRIDASRGNIAIDYSDAF